MFGAQLILIKNQDGTWRRVRPTIRLRDVHGAKLLAVTAPRANDNPEAPHAA